MKIKYENIYLVQSYPAVNSIINRIYAEDAMSLIIVIGNKSLENFLKELFHKKGNIKVSRFGNYNLLYSRVKKLYYPFHLFFLRLLVKNFSCKNLIVTFKDWRYRLIQLKKIKSLNKINLVTYEEQQFIIKDKKPSSFQDFIYYFFHRLLIGKNLSLKYTNPFINRKSPLIGISDKFYRNNNFKTQNLGKIEIDKAIIKNYQNIYEIRDAGIIFIEKDLFGNDIVSRDEYWNFIRNLVRKANSINLEVYLKFKPRNYKKSLEKKYIRYGFKVLPHHIPIQFFYNHPNLVSGIGFTSSGMAYNDSFKIISFAKAIKINKSAEKIVNRSIKNTLKRSATKTIHFPESVEEIISEIKSLQTSDN